MSDPSTGTRGDDVKECVNENGRNKCQLVCVRCKSKILPPDTGTFEEKEFELESFEKDSAGVKETVKNFFRVEDMFMFDNLGFTNTVNTTKFLSCADCDLGPIGFHDLNTRISYVALSRVAYL